MQPNQITLIHFDAGRWLLFFLSSTPFISSPIFCLSLPPYSVSSFFFFLSSIFPFSFVLLPRLCWVALCMVRGNTVVVSLIQLSWQTSPQGQRAPFLKSALSHSGTWFAFRLKPVGTLKSYLWAEGSPSSLWHEGISYCQAKQLQTHKCRQAHTHTHTAESWWKHEVFLVYKQVKICIGVVAIIKLARASFASNQCNGLSDEEGAHSQSTRWSAVL